MKTVHAKKHEQERAWHLIDAKEHVLGRMCTEVACILRGKRSPKYTPHVDTGDFVVVINSAEVQLTGKKETDKMYHNHSQFPGGLKSVSAEVMRERHPNDIIIRAVRGMLPKGALGYEMLRKLKVYPGPEHPHQAQNPEKLDF